MDSTKFSPSDQVSDRAALNLLYTGGPGREDGGNGHTGAPLNAWNGAAADPDPPPPAAVAANPDAILEHMWIEGTTQLDWAAPDQRRETNHKAQRQRGFTPPTLALRAAGLIVPPNPGTTFRIIDPCAGTGVLAAAAAINLTQQESRKPGRIKILAVEINPRYAAAAARNLKTLAAWAQRYDVEIIPEVAVGDFFNPQDWTGCEPRNGLKANADLAILNPPDKPILNNSALFQAAARRGVPGISFESLLFIETARQCVRPENGQVIAVANSRWMDRTSYGMFRRKLSDDADLTDVVVYPDRRAVAKNIFGIRSCGLSTTILRRERGPRNTAIRLTVNYTNAPGAYRGVSVQREIDAESVYGTRPNTNRRREFRLPPTGLDDALLDIFDNLELEPLHHSSMTAESGKLLARARTADAGSPPVYAPPAVLAVEHIPNACVKNPEPGVPEVPALPDGLPEGYPPDTDRTKAAPYAPGFYIAVSGPRNGTEEPSPRAALVTPETTQGPFVVTNRVIIIGRRPADGRRNGAESLDRASAEALTRWFNSAPVRRRTRAVLHTCAVSRGHVRTTPVPGPGLLQRIIEAREERWPIEHAMTAELAADQMLTLDRTRMIEHAKDILREELAAPRSINNEASAAALAALRRASADGRNPGTRIRDLTTLIHREVDIQYNRYAAAWFENNLIPWMVGNGAARVDPEARIILDDRIGTLFDA